MPIISLADKSALAIIIFLNYHLNNQVQCLKQEPKQSQDYKLNFWEAFEDYRAIFELRGLYHLKSAGILNNKEVQSDLESKFNYNSKDESLDFDSNEHVRKSLSWQTFTAGADVTSRHIYDDPNDIKLAAGPQVNQRWCRLHLDYMLHMVNKHNRHVTRSTELSIFSIMNSFGSPSLGFASGNPIFPGDYRACLENKLNVIKRELIQVNKQEAENFFNQANLQEVKVSKSLLKRLSETLILYLAKLVGSVDRNGESENELVQEYSHKMRLVPTRYCFAALRWPNWPNGSFYRRNMVLRSAACLPDTCDSSSIELYHDKIKQLSELQMPDYFKGFYISHLYCLPDENSNFRNPLNNPKTLFFINLTMFWIFLNTIATLITHFTEQKDFQNSNINKSPNIWLQYLSCLCLIKNSRNFLMLDEVEKKRKASSDTQDEDKCKDVQPIDLNPLEGLKVIASFAVIAAHGMVLSSTSCWNPNQNHMIMSSSILATISTIGPSSVDLFFVITGILTSIGLMKLTRKTLANPAFWVKFLILRYVRIVPFYFVIHLALQTIPKYLASGPFWDYGTSHTSWAHVCENDSLWNVILLLANFKSPIKHCNPAGWYLANDIQFSLVTPFIILLYLKKPLIAHLTVMVTCFAVVVNHIKFYYNLPQGRGGLEFSGMTINYLLKDAASGYTNPQYRCLAYFIGLSAGQLLHQYGHGQIKQWPKGFVSACKVLIWSVIYILCVGPYMALMLPLNNLPILHLLGSIVGGTIHGITSLGVAALIILLCTGHLPSINNLLSLKIFRPFARASLSTVLIHITIIFYHTHTRRIPIEISVYQVVTNNSIWIVESLLLSAVLHVAVELPLRKLATKSLMSMFANKKIEQESTESMEISNKLEQKIKSS